MAEERSFQQRQETGQSGQSVRYPDLDERLAAYYGSALPEQSLPTLSWQQVRSQLGSRPRSRRRAVLTPRIARLRRPRPAMPSYISQTFFRIAYDARVPIVRTNLDCRFRRRVQLPVVSVSPFGRGKIRLTLPASAVSSMEPPLLDVLLATGIARLLYARKLSYLLVNLLLMSLALLASLACLVLWLQNRIPLLDFLIAIGLWIVVGALLHVRGRRLALRADDLMVQWLGRARTCQGLHMLADHSRKTRLVRWREPSLAERIARVCGTQVAVEDERLTLVR